MTEKVEKLRAETKNIQEKKTRKNREKRQINVEKSLLTMSKLKLKKIRKIKKNSGKKHRKIV